MTLPRIANAAAELAENRPISSGLKTGLKTGLKILEALKNNPAMTIPQLMFKFELSQNGVKWNLAELKRKGLLRRVGPKKGGNWEVVS